MNVIIVFYNGYKRVALIDPLYDPDSKAQPIKFEKIKLVAYFGCFEKVKKIFDKINQFYILYFSFLRFHELNHFPLIICIYLIFFFEYITFRSMTSGLLPLGVCVMLHFSSDFL
ncbi:uncharacterized protein CELE_Y26D4A.5 [Caenorhabditis elegans]|uniref:Uncharacterized protein n=1 Tax=Caenorhabditis elegans TaxID=6239 RepID=Q9U2Q1_CAEEL|nr:Uncharacterized protein CELE_Y26D4A.5 [Caenorhabditis elegans]CAB54343.2 Uncharacterized protein CELE_Y26D4A.5 [Caenorhabditis elegans]|eukprot:NP_493288.2 Uncharacterized protein CELE_Y26D4A.5 [Caenorhabditis elegans]